MFLAKDNQLKWGWIAAGAAVVGIAIYLMWGMVDEKIWIWAKHLNCNFWMILGDVFSWKMWILATSVILAVYFIKRVVKTIQEYKKERKQFKLVECLQENWQKTKRSNAFLIFCSVFCACVVVAVLKPLIARLRPIMALTQNVPEVVNRFVWEWNSMPSGHTTVSFAGLVMIGMLAPRFKPMTWTLAILIGLSRVIVGHHYATDVILGAFIGMVIADVVKWWLLRKSK